MTLDVYRGRKTTMQQQQQQQHKARADFVCSRCGIGVCFETFFYSLLSSRNLFLSYFLISWRKKENGEKLFREISVWLFVFSLFLQRGATFVISLLFPLARRPFQTRYHLKIKNLLADEHILSV